MTLEEEGLLGRCWRVPSLAASDTDLLRAHSPEHVFQVKAWNTEHLYKFGCAVWCSCAIHSFKCVLRSPEHVSQVRAWNRQEAFKMLVFRRCEVCMIVSVCVCVCVCARAHVRECMWVWVWVWVFACVCKSVRIWVLSYLFHLQLCASQLKCGCNQGRMPSVSLLLAHALPVNLMLVVLVNDPVGPIRLFASKDHGFVEDSQTNRARLSSPTQSAPHQQLTLDLLCTCGSGAKNLLHTHPLLLLCR